MSTVPIALCFSAAAPACRSSEDTVHASAALKDRLRQRLKRFSAELSWIGQATRADHRILPGSCSVEICEALEQRAGKLPLASADRLRWVAGRSGRPAHRDPDVVRLLNSPSVLALRPLGELHTLDEVTSVAYHAKKLQDTSVVHLFCVQLQKLRT